MPAAEASAKRNDAPPAATGWESLRAAFRRRVGAFLETLPDRNPCLVVDLETVRGNYRDLAEAMPGSDIYYAIKANPAPEIVRLLAAQGAGFDVASPWEIDLVLDQGIAPERVSYGNTIKKEADIGYAYRRGIRLFAVDCLPEVEKIARAAPGARVFCRLLVDNKGAEWPLSRKFGCDPEMAAEVLESAARAGLVAHGVSFHVGSQQPDPKAWDSAIAASAALFKALAARGIHLAMLNLGGGFPARYLKDVPTAATYGRAINASLRHHFGEKAIRTAIEPGRFVVGTAGIIRSEVVLVSKKSAADTLTWVYLDIGKFTGLAETMDESIRYPITTPRDGDPKIPCIVAGPTCDSVDVLYEKTPYPLPRTLQPGDKIWIESAGAYTSAYAADCFNGFEPPKTYCIPALRI